MMSDTGATPARAGLSPEETTRLLRVDTLSLHGEGAVEPLIAMLDDPSWIVRRSVVAALASIGDPAVAPLCAVLLGERGHEAKLAATVDALVASRGEGVAGHMVPLARHKNPAIAAEAANVLGRRRERGSVPLLVELTHHADDNVAVAAGVAERLDGGRAAVEALVNTVRSGHFFRAFPAIDVLGRGGDPRAVEPLASLLSSPFYAPEAARALGRTGDRGAVSPLASLLDGRGEATARVAASALSELAGRFVARGGERKLFDATLRDAARGAVRHLVQALASADQGEQIAICDVLGVLGGEPAVAALSRLLDGPSPVALAAGAALARLAEEADTQLVLSLEESNSARRLILLPLLSRAGAVPGILRCLDDEDPTVRAAACDALARIGRPTAVPQLFRLLADANPRVVQAAVGAIQSLGSDATERLALEAARAGWPSVRRAGLRILSYFGYASALPLFVEALRDADPRVRDAAVQGLPFIDHPEALEELLRAARDPNERIRAGVMRSLGHCRGDARVVSYLLRGLGDVEPWVRYYGCQSLGRLGVETAAAAISRLLDDGAGQVRVAAIEALSHLRSESAFAALRHAAASGDPDVQRAALVGLGISRRPEAEPLLLEAIEAQDAATRLVAVSAIADLDGPEVMQALVRAAGDRDESVRSAAIGFLAGRSGAAPTAALVSLLTAAPEKERLISALALPAEGRVAGLAQALADADDELAPHLVSALARMHRPDAEKLLVDSMSSANVAARKAAAFAVANGSSPEGLAALRRASTGDADAEVRRIATLLLAS